MDFLLTKKNLILYLIIILLLLLNIGFNVYVNYFNVEEEVKENVSIVKEVEEAIPVMGEEKDQKYYVDIKGSVKNPGVYLVDRGTIINDVINMAGGLNKNASTKYINLSKMVKNEMVIYIYNKDELVEKKELNEECICEEIKECIDNKESIIIENGSNKVIEDKKETNNEEVTDTKIENNNKVNINTADVSLLQTLSGIGESKAVSIIEYRNTNGLFKSIEDIKNVSGIGDAAYEKIKDYITV